VSAPSGRELGDALTEPAARFLRLIALAMGGGVAVLAAVAVWLDRSARGRLPDPRLVRFVNLATIVAMAAALALILVSEAVWRRMLARASAKNADAAVRGAFVARSALREGAALLGLLIVFLAAGSGVLRLYPAYWVNLAPTVLFWSYLYAHRPTLDKLRAELADALPPAS
jgi:hypothetical protein